MKSDVRITGNQVQITRIFAASRERLFAAWKQPHVLEQWTGCKDATNVQCEMDFRVGGGFTQKMHIATHGCDCVITGQYDEIVEPEKIVYRVNLGPATTHVTVEFIAQGNETKVVLTQDGFPDPGLSQIVSQGTIEAFDKLDQILVGQAA
jgi:uncharacterized protein YndB with AHSA1/START domain